MKKQKIKERKSKKFITPELPQNILPVGERVLEDKNIYIHQKVYNQIHKFAANKTENEHGGILVGRVLNEMGKENTIIEGFIEAKYNSATPTTLTFTHDTWEYFHSELAKRHKDKKIVGWIHTHPNFGIFLSDNDKFIQENFFADSNQVAYVVDPIQNEEGFYFWIQDKLERCPGFYLFDKNGAKIKQKIWESEDEQENIGVKRSKVNAWITALLVIALIVNASFTFWQGNRISELEKQVEDHELFLEYALPDVVNMYTGVIMEQMLTTGSTNMYVEKLKIEVSETADAIREDLKRQEEALKLQQPFVQEIPIQNAPDSGEDTADAGSQSGEIKDNGGNQ